jgi:putative ABC transport system permease protein
LFFLFVLFLWRREISLLVVKNLCKNRRRTLILLCVIVSGLTGLIEFFGYAEHSIYNLREATIHTGMGHIQLYKKGYNATGNVEKLKYNIAHYQEIVSILTDDPFLKDKIKSIGAELEFSGIVANQSTSSVFFGKGIEIGKDELLSYADELVGGKKLAKARKSLRPTQHTRLREFEGMFDDFQIAGVDSTTARPPLNKKEKKENQSLWEQKQENRSEKEVEDIPAINDALIGQGLSTALQAKVGSTLTLMVATQNGSLNAVDIHVRGIIRGFSKEYNDAIIKIPLQYAWTLMNRQDVTKISILLKSTEMTEMVAQRIEELLMSRPGLEYTTWKDVAIQYHRVHAFFAAIFFFIGTLITIVVFFSIANVMTMSVMERTREIGTLRSLGETRWGIMEIFLREGMVIGVVGGILSILCGIGLAEFINMGGGIPHPPPPGSTKGFQVFLYVANRPVIWGVAFLLSFFSALFSSILPAKKASSMEIVAALRYT